MQLSDRLTGPVIAALGAAAAYGGSLLPNVPGQQVGPNVFPMVVGSGLVVCGLLIAFGIGRSFEEEAEADLARSEAAKGLVDEPAEARHSGWLALLPPALLVFYAVAVDPLGFVPTAALMIVALCLAFGGSLKLAIPLAIVAAAFVHLVFYKLLRVPLPPGLLPMPWA